MDKTQVLAKMFEIMKTLDDLEMGPQEKNKTIKKLVNELRKIVGEGLNRPEMRDTIGKATKDIKMEFYQKMDSFTQIALTLGQYPKLYEEHKANLERTAEKLQKEIKKI